MLETQVVGFGYSKSPDPSSHSDSWHFCPEITGPSPVEGPSPDPTGCRPRYERLRTAGGTSARWRLGSWAGALLRLAALHLLPRVLARDCEVVHRGARDSDRARIGCRRPRLSDDPRMVW